MRSQTGTSGTGERPVLARLRGLLTVLVTLAVIGGEVLLLSAVYHRGDDVQDQRLVHARLAGEVADGAVGDLTPTLDSLAAAGVPEQDLRELRSATQQVTGSPTTETETRLLAATDDLGTLLAGRSQRIDRQADGVYATLIVIVSIGWFVWFRRLVRRHRHLEHVATEAEALAASEQRLLTLVQNGSDLVAVFDADGTTTFVSPSARAVLGLESDQVLGGRVADLLTPEDVPVLVGLMATLRPDAEQALQVRAPHADGRALVLEGVLSNRLADPTVEGFVLTVRDATERHALAERLAYQAFHDALTGLANRQLFSDRLGHALSTPLGEERPLVLLYCDLDDFKNVNDSRGHGVGDALLTEVGARIGAAVRAGDTAARLGGDEFAVLMEDTDLDEGLMVAERILADLAVPVDLDGTRLPVQISIGLATAIPGRSSAEEALRNADVAMYWAKDRGKSTVAVYDAQLHDEALARLELRSDLQRALRGRPARAALPADDPPAHGRDQRVRGARPLAPPRARAALSRRLRADGRGDRPDRRGRLLGAPDGVRVRRCSCSRTYVARRWPSTSRRGSWCSPASWTRCCRCSSRPACRRTGSPSRSPRASC